MTGVEESAGTAVKMLEILKDLPLWLLSGLAVAFGLLLAVPSLAASLPTAARPWILVATVVLGVLALARAISVLVQKIPDWRATADRQRRFHLISDPQQSHWSSSKQADDSIVTQVVARFLVKNRTSDSLALVGARLISPRIRGEILHADVSVRAVDDRFYGTPRSGYTIPPGMSLPASVHILIGGVPRKKLANQVKVLVGVSDDEGYERRVRIDMRVIARPQSAATNPAIELVSSILNPVEREVATVLQAELSRYEKCGRLTGGLGSIHLVLNGREMPGVGTDSWTPNSPKNQSIFENPTQAEIRSDNMEALLAFYQRLSSIEERGRFASALLGRLDGKGYLSVSYFIVSALWKIGKLREALERAKTKLPQGEIKVFGLSNVLMLLNGLLRYRHPEFTNEMLDDIERFLVELNEHPFQIPEKIAAIRTARLVNPVTGDNTQLSDTQRATVSP